MTDPLHDPDQDRPRPGAVRPGDPARPGDAGRSDDDVGPDEATVERLRQLLRDEPVDDDELARERRVRVALAAAVPPARRAAPRRWLAAAAIVSVMGIGGYLVVTVNTGTNDETASNDTSMVAEADSGVDVGTVTAEEEPGSAGRALTQDGTATTITGMQQEATGAPPAPAVDASVVDLGPVASRAAAIAAAEALEQRTDSAGALLRRIPDAQTLRCIDQQRALALDVIAVATLDDRELVVVRSPTGPLVLDAVSCVPLEP